MVAESFPAHSSRVLVQPRNTLATPILLKIHTHRFCSSICRRSDGNLQVVLPKEHTTLGRIYAILYHECASDKTLGLLGSQTQVTNFG